jgi:hypothetical protein
MPVPVKRRAVIRKIGVTILGVSVVAAGGLAIGRLNWPLVAKQARTVLSFSPRSLPLIPTLLVIATVVILLLWKLPVAQVTRSKGLTDESRFDRENEARKTLAQILAGAFVLAGLYSSVQTFNLSREGQITDRFTKAIEQLGALDGAGKPKPEIRLGGIYALERVARDSERDHWVIMEVLTAYIREHSPRNKYFTDHPPSIGADIQAIVAVIGGREAKYDKGLLSLPDTYLFEADLHRASLNGADFGRADLREASFDGAYLVGAFLSHADLRLASFDGAHLDGALLVGADLDGANLSRASLNGADFSGATLDNAQATQAQIDSARGDRDTKLPAGLKKPEHWRN